MSSSNTNLSNTNLFGTFLDTLAKHPAPDVKAAAIPMPIDEVLKVLRASANPIPLKGLMGAANNSANMLLGTLEVLEGRGMILRKDGGLIGLTTQGREIADLIAS